MGIDLKDINPQRSCFKLKATGNHKHFVRVISVSDEIWMAQTLGDEDGNLPNIAENMIDLCRVIYHQLEDKTPFKSQLVTLIDEDGHETQEERGGYKLFLSLVSGMHEKIEILNAWLCTIGASRPVQKTLKKKL